MPQGFATHGKLPFVFLVIDWNWSFYSILRVFLEQGWFQLIWLLVLHTQSPPWLTHCIMDSQHLPLFFRMPSAFVAHVHSWVSIISKLTSNEWCFAVRQHALLVLLEEFFFISYWYLKHRFCTSHLYSENDCFMESLTNGSIYYRYLLRRCLIWGTEKERQNIQLNE